MLNQTQSYRVSERPVDFSLRDLVGPIFRRKKIVLITFFSVFMAVILAGILIPPPYKSQMAVLVNRERADPLVSTEATNQVPPSGAAEVTVEEINSEAQLLLSLDLLEKVVVATGMDKDMTWLDSLMHRTPQEKIEHEAKRLAKKIKVKNETNSNIIDISYNSQNPREAYNVLKALGDFYVQKHVEVHHAPGSSAFFAEETQKYHDALQRSEDELKAYSQTHEVAAPDVERTDLANQVALTTGQLLAAQQAAAAAAERIRVDGVQMSTTPERATTQEASAPADKLLSELNATLIAAQAKRTQLALKYDPNYPLVREADEEVAAAKSAIAKAETTRYTTETTDRDATWELLREDSARSRADLASQKAIAKAAGQSIESLQKQMVELEQQAITQGDLLREVKANESNYLLYLAKREQERTTDAMDKTRIANVAIAVPPAIPALPIYSIPLVVLAGFGLALVLSIGFAYTVDYFDTSFHSPAQVSDLLGIPIVVAMPKRVA